jgi:hypothetical protein
MNAVVGEGGLEPPRPYEHWHLKPARLPFRHSPELPVERYPEADECPTCCRLRPLITGTLLRLGS